MAILNITPELYRNERLMDAIDRFSDTLEVVGYWGNAIQLRLLNDEIPESDVEIELLIHNWHTKIKSTVIEWNRLT